MSAISASQRNAFAAPAVGLRLPANGLNNNNANNNPRIDGWAGV